MNAENQLNTAGRSRSRPAARGSTALSDRELVQEMLQCLRINMMRETMTTVDDEQFWKFLDAWSGNRSALGIAPSNSSST